jgi:hypothetical protein
MLAGHLALILAAAFAGAAFYVNFAEHPARLGLDDQNLLRQWKPSYEAGYIMQASFAAVSGALGLLSAWISHDWHWIHRSRADSDQLAVHADRDHADQPQAPGRSQRPGGGLAARGMLERWGRLHAVRTVPGIAATAAYLWALH